MELHLRVVSAASILLGLSETSTTAWRYPVYCSAASWRCDRCGNPMKIGGSSKIVARHECPDDATDSPLNGAIVYVGVKEHLANVFEAARSTFVTNLPSRETHGSAGPRIRHEVGRSLRRRASR